jgi:hypothetical protein
MHLRQPCLAHFDAYGPPFRNGHDAWSKCSRPFVSQSLGDGFKATPSNFLTDQDFAKRKMTSHYMPERVGRWCSPNSKKYTS